MARVLAHVPDPRRHIVHYYGAYSNVVRGKQKARAQAQQAEPPAPGPHADPLPPPSPALAALRRRWAELIRRVYGVDPLLCPRCRGVMRVVAFITARSVIRRILDHLDASARRATQGRAPSLILRRPPVFPAAEAVASVPAPPVGRMPVSITAPRGPRVVPVAPLPRKPSPPFPNTARTP